jgi:hypothetical protein
MVLFQKVLIVSAALMLAGSCGLVNEDEVVVPAYISIPSFTFVTNADNSQGANSQAFNDMWITNGGILLGSLGTPSLLPVQKSGFTDIGVDAGISNTGQDNSRLAYPFIETFIQTKDLKPGMIDTIRPVFRYSAGTGFKFIEDFDRVTRTFQFNTIPGLYDSTDTLVAVTDQHAWRPNTADHSIKIQIPATQDVAQLITKEEYELFGAGAPAFIEIDYKSNLPLDIGYYYIEPGSAASLSQTVVLTYPSETWKKLYVDLTGEISSRRAGTKYIIYIGVQNLSHLEPQIYIDNVKLVHFK